MSEETRTTEETAESAPETQPASAAAEPSESEGNEAREDAPGSGQPVAATFAQVPSAHASGESGPIERVFDLEVPVHVELGRTRLTIEEILRLRPGAVVELDRAADRPVDLMVHGKRVARGEIVVVDDYYGIRITEVGGDD